MCFSVCACMYFKFLFYLQLKPITTKKPSGKTSLKFDVILILNSIYWMKCRLKDKANIIQAFFFSYSDFSGRCYLHKVIYSIEHLYTHTYVKKKKRSFYCFLKIKQTLEKKLVSKRWDPTFRFFIYKKVIIWIWNINKNKS